MKSISKILESIITNKIEAKAEELGIEFKVKHSIKDGLDDILIQIKRDSPTPKIDWKEEEFKAYKELVDKHNTFADFAADIVVGNFTNQIRFSYLSKL